VITTRRSALKILGGCLLVPSLKIRPEYDLHGIVRNFCRSTDEVEWRFDLREPFVMDGNAYGTDGRAAARIVATDEDTSTDTRRLPVEITDIWADFWSTKGRWMSMPADRYVRGSGACPRCWDNRAECDECFGTGEAVRTTQYGEILSDCKRCHGTGQISDASCEICHGRLWGDDYPCRQVVGHKLISFEFWRKVQAIPGAMVSMGGPDRLDPILVKSDIGVECLVMPMKP